MTQCHVESGITTKAFPVFKSFVGLARLCTHRIRSLIEATEALEIVAGRLDKEDREMAAFERKSAEVGVRSLPRYLPLIG